MLSAFVESTQMADASGKETVRRVMRLSDFDMRTLLECDGAQLSRAIPFIDAFWLADAIHVIMQVQYDIVT